jgi:sugar phosphate isomerase/epimerase
MQKQVVTRVDWREIWQRVREVTQEEWEGQKRELRESYQRVVETVTRYDKWQNEYGISGSLAVLAHTAYHLGGIRQALRAIKPATSHRLKVNIDPP